MFPFIVTVASIVTKVVTLKVMSDVGVSVGGEGGGVVKMLFI